MSIILNEVQDYFLEPSSISLDDLSLVLESMMSAQIDNSDIYFQSVKHESWGLEDGIVKDASFNSDRGVGIRAMYGEKTGFAYSEDINLKSIQQAAGAAASIAGYSATKKITQFKPTSYRPIYKSLDPLNGLSEHEKIHILQSMDELARSKDSRVKQVMASLSGVYEQILVLASDGTIAADIRPLVRVNISVIAEHNGKRERGSSGGGGRLGYQDFLNTTSLETLVDQAIHQANVNLEAVDAPAGSMPVILGPGWPGVLLHEAVGHGLEGDFNRKGSSTYSGRIGEKVASENVTIVDDGTIADARGSLSIDDEGVESRQNVLIENGVLKKYMQDKRNSRLMGCEATGNGRRESYAHLPLPRMTNTYMLAGNDSPEDIIKSVKRGLYAPNFGGGQVDITSGKFVFSTSEAYLIEDGKVTQPVKGATLIGNGPEVMSKVSMVGNDLSLDAGVGVCGKDGQSVPVGVGQPTLKIDELVVGGTQ